MADQQQNGGKYRFEEVPEDPESKAERESTIREEEKRMADASRQERTARTPRWWEKDLFRSPEEIKERADQAHEEMQGAAGRAMRLRRARPRMRILHDVLEKRLNEPEPALKKRGPTKRK